MAFFDTCQGEDGFQMHFPSPLDPFKKQKTRDGPPDIRHGVSRGYFKTGVSWGDFKKNCSGGAGGNFNGGDFNNSSIITLRLMRVFFCGE